MIRSREQSKLRTPHRHRRGFTLVEMMVATALVVMMMLMFAQVFQTSSGLVSNQKGMAELDQSTRTLTTLLRGDIKQRTFIDVVPFVRNQNTDSAQVGYEAEFRRGYLSISENDPLNRTDDSLHLTITTRSAAKRPEERDKSLPFSGRATLLRVPEANGGPTDAQMDETSERIAYLLGNPDQPEFDDGQITENATGSSEYAEVSWFLRNGTLYRRQLLIRNPYNRGGNTDSEEDPLDGTGTEEFIPRAYGSASYRPNANARGVFWNDFDYAAYAQADPNPMVLTNHLKFHSMPAALNNDSTSEAITELANLPASLGIPLLRYGSSISRVSGGQILGPREYLGADYDITNPTAAGFNAASYIGRFTVQETAHSSFSYPGRRTPTDDPYSDSTLALNSDALVGKFAGQRFRRGEDIVMKNVHEFDIQVWDDVIGGFVNLGHTQSNAAGVAGLYNRSQMTTWPDNHPFGNRYDTWHPHSSMPADPPYAPFDGTRTGPERGLGSPDEVSLKAIRIHIRFFDENSEQMRDLTFTFRLDRKSSAD